MMKRAALLPLTFLALAMAAGGCRHQVVPFREARSAFDECGKNPRGVTILFGTIETIDFADGDGPQGVGREYWLVLQKDSLWDISAHRRRARVDSVVPVLKYLQSRVKRWELTAGGPMFGRDGILVEVSYRSHSGNDARRVKLTHVFANEDSARELATELSAVIEQAGGTAPELWDKRPENESDRARRRGGH